MNWNGLELCPSRYLIASLVFIVLNGIDAYVTRWLMVTDMVFEGNPIMKSVNANMLVKVGLSALVAISIYVLYRVNKWVGKRVRLSWVMLWLNVGMVCVVVWNSILYLVIRTQY